MDKRRLLGILLIIIPIIVLGSAFMISEGVEWKEIFIIWGSVISFYGSISIGVYLMTK